MKQEAGEIVDISLYREILCQSVLNQGHVDDVQGHTR